MCEHPDASRSSPLRVSRLACLAGSKACVICLAGSDSSATRLAGGGKHRRGPRWHLSESGS